MMLIQVAHFHDSGSSNLTVNSPASDVAVENGGMAEAWFRNDPVAVAPSIREKASSAVRTICLSVWNDLLRSRYANPIQSGMSSNALTAPNSLQGN